MADPLGESINPPDAVGSLQSGFPTLITNLIRVATIVGGLLVMINFFLAGFEFLTAGGDPKKIQEAWKKIWQSLVGLIIIVAALTFMGLINKVVFRGDFDILTPTFIGPGDPGSTSGN